MYDLQKFINDQLSVWPLVSSNFRALKSSATRNLKIFGLDCLVQHNPARVASTTANTRPEAIAARPCFLCSGNRPPQQFHLKFEGRKGRNYNIQINPYPIFPNHLVIVREEHVPQAIWHHLPDILDFVHIYRDFTAFYNGPMSGASAPDHLHFQACPRGMMPLEKAVDAFLDNPGPALAVNKDALLYHFKSFTHGVFALKATTSKSMAKLFYRLLDCTDHLPGETEPRFNLFCYFKGDEYRVFVVLRSESRSHHYFSDGEDHLTMSPGAADMAGMLVAPFADDYRRLDTSLAEQMLSEVCIAENEEEMIKWRLTRTERKIDVGIMRAREIRFEIISDGAGPQRVSWKDGRICYNGALYDELYFDSITRSTLFDQASFILYDVVIGIDFHWQRNRDLRYAGGLKFIVDGDYLVAVNRVGMENYLLSVISSEMKASASLELLKAHAVISRSWLLCNLGSHVIFDVCADDHCQRYQGLSMAVGDNVRRAIDETWGQVLRYEGEICDARYSKCCGGRTELFSTCWEDRDYPYLQSFEDRPSEDGLNRSSEDGPDMASKDEMAGDFCDCEDSAILSQVLNDYDMETRDFYRWEQRFRPDELRELLKRRTGIDYGEIESMEPVETGPSGRIKYLHLCGTLQTGVIGKELAIRRALSESHLKSSAFSVIREDEFFVLKGRGWGHGVGLCQIGAAVMASRGYSYIQILKHYYRGAEVEQ